MKTHIVYLSIILILLLVLVMGFVIRCRPDERTNAETLDYEIFVSNPETAIEIARVLLIERFPRGRYGLENAIFIAEENDGIWIVREVPPPPVTVNDRTYFAFGVFGYVHLRKNGEVLKLGRE